MMVYTYNKYCMKKINKRRIWSKKHIFLHFLLCFLIVLNFLMKLGKTQIITKMCFTNKTPKHSLRMSARCSPDVLGAAHVALLFAAKQSRAFVLGWVGSCNSSCSRTCFWGCWLANSLAQSPSHFKMKIKMVHWFYSIWPRHVLV